MLDLQKSAETLIKLAIDSENWVPMKDLNWPGMTYQQVKYYLAGVRRADPESARRFVVKTGHQFLVNRPLFGAYLAGLLTPGA